MKVQKIPLSISNNHTSSSEKQSDITIICTRYAYKYPDGGYTGLDLELGKKISKIRYLPILNVPWPMLGGKFQGSNISPDSGYEDLYTIDKTPHMGWNEAVIDSSRTYRFVRYLGPPGQHSMVSKIEYYTLEPDIDSSGGFREIKLQGIPFGTTPCQDWSDSPDAVYREGHDILLSYKDWSLSAGCPFYIDLNPSDHVFYHQHDFMELIYIKSGSCFHFHRNQIEYLFAGDMFIIPPYETHMYWGGENLHIVNILLYPDRIADNAVKEISGLPGFGEFLPKASFRLEGISCRKYHLYIEQQREIMPILEGMLRDFAGRTTGYHLYLSSSFTLLLVHFSRYFSDMLNASGKSDLSPKYTVISKAIDYLVKNYAVIKNVDEMVKYLNVSYSWLASIFKKETGLPIHDYLSRVRIGHACQKLIETGEDITGIAYDTGFKNYSNFSRLFKQLTGYSPQEFRNFYVTQ